MDPPTPHNKKGAPQLDCEQDEDADEECHRRLRELEKQIEKNEVKARKLAGMIRLMAKPQQPQCKK